ncbi:serine/threonine-protein kinase par-1-like [Periplaneta americana]|uniref:serine/threonine-protein kinase par-1-like n=1 Tax=Periplaneta americana TaxID=6978 RepID=UPI0037E8C81F
MENGTDMEDNEINVDNEFSSGSSQNTNFILHTSFQSEQTNYQLRTELPCSSVHSSKKCSRPMKTCERNNCTFKSKTEEAQEVPECEVSSDDDEQQKTARVQQIENHVRTRLTNTNESKRRKFEIPKEGTPVESKVVKRAGPYLLGPTLGSSPVKSIVQCLARRDGTDDFYTLKILTLRDGEEETQDDRQGKMLLHTEYSLLSLLHNQDGVIHHHGFFKDCALEERQTSDGRLVYTGRIKQRLCLVLDCLCAHDFSSRNADLLNLQHYVIREKKLSERESIVIFYDVVRVVESLHKRNIVHRDLKLGNLVLNRRTRRVTITNFCLGKHLGSENDLLKDQRGSPAYISPDVLCGKPYLGKPSDMWALGVVLFTMLYGQFPFYDSSPTQLFSKIKAADYSIPSDGRVSESTIALIHRLLVLEPQQRMTASEVLDSLSVIIASSKVGVNPYEALQVVPDIDDPKDDKIEVKQCLQEEPVMEKTENFSHQITLQEQIENVQHIRQSTMAVQRSRRVGHIPVQRIGQDAREVTAEELTQYQHLLPRTTSTQPLVPAGRPFSVVTQSIRNPIPQPQAPNPTVLDAQRTPPLSDNTPAGRPSSSSYPHHHHHHHSSSNVSVPMYQVQCNRGLASHTDSSVPAPHRGGCLAQGVRSLTAVQSQGSEVGQQQSASSVVKHNHRKCLSVTQQINDMLSRQQQPHASDSASCSNSSSSSSNSSSNNRVAQEGGGNSAVAGPSGSTNPAPSQVETVITSVVLSNRDTTSRQQQLASFLSSLGLASAVSVPAIPYVCNSHQSDAPGHAVQQATRTSDNVRSVVSVSRNLGSSAQPLRYHVREGTRSSLLQRESQIRRVTPRHYTISPRIQRNIVQNLSLIIRSRLEAGNHQTSDDSSSGRRN